MDRQPTKFKTVDGKTIVRFEGVEDIEILHKENKKYDRDGKRADGTIYKKGEVYAKKGDFNVWLNKYKFAVKALRRRGGTYTARFSIDVFGDAIGDDYKPTLLAYLMAHAGLIDLDEYFPPDSESFDEMDDFDDESLPNKGVEADTIDDDFDSPDDDVEGKPDNLALKLNESDILNQLFICELSSCINEDNWEDFYILPSSLELYEKAKSPAKK